MKSTKEQTIDASDSTQQKVCAGAMAAKQGTAQITYRLHAVLCMIIDLKILTKYKSNLYLYGLLG
jgi:hypothetical protein